MSDQPTLFPQQAFHQRNRMRSSDVARGERSAASQEAAILAWFREHPQVAATPPEVHAALALTCPLTSVRRAMSNLTKRGELVKDVVQQKPGLYGQANCTWRLAK